MNSQLKKMPMKKKKYQIPFYDVEDFGTLCICALRYCHGRETYMPDLVRSIIRPLLPMLTDRDINVMIQDCEFQAKYDLYGDKYIDKPGWLQWESELRSEKRKRSDEGAD